MFGQFKNFWELTVFWLCLNWIWNTISTTGPYRTLFILFSVYFVHKQRESNNSDESPCVKQCKIQLGSARWDLKDWKSHHFQLLGYLNIFRRTWLVLVIGFTVKRWWTDATTCGLAPPSVISASGGLIVVASTHRFGVIVTQNRHFSVTQPCAAIFTTLWECVS